MTRVSDLKYADKQKVFRARGTSAIDTMLVYNGYVSPLCFCNFEKGEKFFLNAHKYFYNISRAVESYGKISKMLGDRIFLNDEELYGVVYRKSKELYQCDKPKLLTPEQKIEMARLMHFSYNSSNAQIERILKMGKSVVEGLFPSVKG